MPPRPTAPAPRSARRDSGRHANRGQRRDLRNDQNRGNAEAEGAKNNALISGPFAGAHHFSIEQMVAVDVTCNLARTSVQRFLLPHINQEALIDSSARYPPPKCFLGTRQRIRDVLGIWLFDPLRKWRMVWLSGPAGVGKSAIAQTFGEFCIERGRFGAAYFFSRQGDQDVLRNIVPTLAYQLAVQHPKYRRLLRRQIIRDPTVMKASMPVQFKKLVVEPLSDLKSQYPQSRDQPHYLVILDGLDECQKEDIQLKIVEMINEVARLEYIPLLWLVCSRPMPHLEYTFSRTDLGFTCHRETLCVDGAQEEADRYLQAGFEDIQKKFPRAINGPWPSEEQLARVSRAASGLFIVASTILEYVGDSERANPPAQLNAILSSIENSPVGTGNPLSILDPCYTQILSDVPADVLPITKRILAHHLYIPCLGREPHWSPSAQTLCNFLHLDQSTFYSALQRLHSVVAVPQPEVAATIPLRLYHTSFGDYLRDRARSGRFALEEQKVLADIAKSFLDWHEVDSTLYHTADGGSVTRRSHEHPALPDLKWASEHNIGLLSQEIALCAELFHYSAWTQTFEDQNQDLLLRINQYNFRHMNHASHGFIEFLNWLHQQTSHDASASIICTEPRNPVDQKLLGHLKLLTALEALEPAQFPLDPHFTGYFIIGYDEKACIFYRSSVPEMFVFGCDKLPLEAQVSQSRSSGGLGPAIHPDAPGPGAAGPSYRPFWGGTTLIIMHPDAFFSSHGFISGDSEFVEDEEDDEDWETEGDDDWGTEDDEEHRRSEGTETHEGLSGSSGEEDDAEHNEGDDDELASPEVDRLVSPEADELASPEADELASPEADELAPPEADELASPEADEGYHEREDSEGEVDEGPHDENNEERHDERDEEHHDDNEGYSYDDNEGYSYDDNEGYSYDDNEGYSYDDSDGYSYDDY